MDNRFEHLISKKKIDLSSGKFKVTLVNFAHIPKSSNNEDITWEVSSGLIHFPPITLNISQLKDE